MDKSVIPSLSRIDEDSVWEKSMNSPSSSSSESEEACMSEKTPEKARQKIKTLEEVLHNTQLDFDTLKEYTVLERQVLNYERVADISQPDILASLVNNSLIMNKSRRSVTNENMDSLQYQMDVSASGLLPTETDSYCCPGELMKSIEELQSENEKLKIQLEQRETCLKEATEKQSFGAETQIIAELQQQIEELSLQNKQYEESIESLSRVKETYEKMNVNDLQDQIKLLQDENNHLKQDAKSNCKFKDLYEEQLSNLHRIQEDHAKLIENTMTSQNHIETLQMECDKVRAQVKTLNEYKERLEEQNLMLRNLKNELQLPEHPENILMSLREYITDLREKYDQAQLQTLEQHDENKTALKNQIADLTKELEELKSEKLEAPETIAMVSSLEQPDVSGKDRDFVIKNLMAEIELHKSEIEALKSSLCNLGADLTTKENNIAALEDEISAKNLLVSRMDCKTNILSSYLMFLTKHLEKLTDNNNALCLLVKDKSNESERLRNHLSGVKAKLKTLVDQKVTDSDKLLDASSYYYDLFESDVGRDLSITEIEEEVQNNLSVLSASRNLNQSIADSLSTSKSFVNFSYCLNTLFDNTNSVIDDTQWLNNASNYFHQLFDSVRHNDALVERPELNNQSFSNTSNYFNNLFKTPNGSILHKTSSFHEDNANNQTLNDTSNYWYNIFDSFLNESEIKPETSRNVSNESVLNVSNYFSNLFKSQNNSVNKLAEMSVLDASNCLNSLFKSQNNSINKSLNISSTLNNSSASNCMEEMQLSSLSAGLQSLFVSNCKSVQNGVNNSFSQSNESQAIVQPEIAMCDGTLNTTAMFNSNHTCIEDPLKSFCGDITITDKVLSPPEFLSNSLSAGESEFDLSLSPESFVKKIVDLKVTLNQFENGLQDLSVRKINVSTINDPLVSCFKVLMKSYTSVYDTLKSLIKTFDLDDLVLEGFEMSLRETSNLLNFTPQYEAVNKELPNLSADLNNQTLLIDNLENQINLETTASRTLDKTISQKESELQDLKDSLMKSNVSTDEVSLTEDFVMVRESDNAAKILFFENELVGLKIDLENKEQKIKELSCTLEELKVKNESMSILQSCYNDLLSKVKFSEDIISGFNEELRKFEVKSVFRKEKIASLLAELGMKDDLIKSKSLEFESIEVQFLKIENEMKKLRDENPAEPVVTTSHPLSEIKEYLICLLDGKMCLEEGILDMLNDVGVLKAMLESKESALNGRLSEQEQTIKELSEKKLDEMRKKTQSLEMDLNDKDLSIKKLLEQIGDFNEDKEYLEAELIKLMKQVDDLTSEVENKDLEMNLFQEDAKFMLEDMKKALKQNMLEVIINNKISHESRISELVAQLNTLQTEKEQCKLQLKLADLTQIKLLEIENELKEKEKFSADLEEQIKSMTEDRVTQEKRMAEFMQEIDALNSLLEEKNSEICSLNALKLSIEELTKEKISYEKRVAELVEEQNILQTVQPQNEVQLKQIELIEAKLVEVEKKLQEKEILASELEIKLRDFEADKEHFESKLNKVLEETDKLREDSKCLAVLEQNVAELTEVRSAKEEHIAELTSRLAELEKAKCEIKASAHETVEMLTLKLRQAEQNQELKSSSEEDKYAKEQQIAELTSQLAELEKTKSESASLAEESMTELRLKLEKSEQDYKKTQVLLEEGKNGYEKRIEELTSQLTELEKAKCESETSAEETLEALSLKLNQAEEDLEEKQMLLKEFQEEWNHCEKEKTRLENEMKHLLEEQDTLKKESKNLVALKENLVEVTETSAAKDKRIEELLQTLSDFEVEKSQNTRFKELAEQANLKLTKTELELQEKEALVAKLEEKLKEFEAAEKYYKDQMIELTQQVNSLKSQIQDQGSVSEFEEKLKDFEVDKKYYEDQMMELMQQVDSLKWQLQSQNEHPKSETSSLALNQILKEGDEEKIVRDHQSRETKLDSDKTSGEYSALEAKLHQEEELIAELKEKLNRVCEEKSGKEAEVSVLLCKLDEFQAKVETQLNEIDRLSKLTHNLEEQVHELSKLKNSSLVEKTCDSLKSEIPATNLSEDQDAEIKRLREELSALSELNVQLKVELAVFVEEKSRVNEDFESKISEKTEALSLVLSKGKPNSEQVIKLTAELNKLEECMNEKNEYITEMEKQMAERQAIIESKSTDIESLKIELSKASRSISEVSSGQEVNSVFVADSSQRVIDLEADISDKMKEILRLSKELEQKSLEVSNLEEQLLDIREKLNEFESTEMQLQQMKTELEKSSKFVVDLEADVLAKTEEISRLWKDLNQKSLDVSDLEKQLSDIREKFNNFESTETQFNETKVQLESDVRAKTEEISTLLNALEMKSSEMNTLEKQLAEMRVNINRLESAETQLQKVKIELETNQNLISVFEQKMDALEEEKKTREEEQSKTIAELNKVVDNKTSEIESLKEKIAKINESKIAAIDELEEKLRLVTETKKTTINDTDVKPQQLESTSSDSNDLRESQIAKQRVIKEIKYLKPEVQTDKIPFSGLVQELMTTILEKQGEIFTQIGRESEALKTENKYLKAKEAEAKKWLTELESENSKLQMLIKEKDDEILSSNEKLSVLKNELKTKDDSVRNLQLQLDLMENEGTKLKSELLEFKNSTAPQQAAEEIKFQTNEINKLTSECDLLRSKLRKEEDSVVSLNKLIDEEIAKFTELNNVCIQLKKELAEILFTNETLKSSLMCRDDEIHQLKETLDRNVASVSEANSLKNKYDEAVNAKEALSADIAVLQRTVDEQVDLIKTLESQASQNVEEVAGLKRDVEEKSGQVSNLSKTVEEKVSEIVRLNALLEQGSQNESGQVLVSEEKLKALIGTSKAAEESGKIIDSLNAEISALKMIVDRHKSDTEEAKKIKVESSKLKVQVEKMSEDTKLLESKLLIEKNRVTIMVSEIKVLEEEKTRLTHNLNQLEMEKVKLMERLTEVKFSSFEHSSSCADSAKKSNDNSPNVMYKRNMRKCEKLNREKAVLEKKVENLMDKEEELASIEISLKSLLPAGSPSSLTSLVGILKQKVIDANESHMEIAKELSQKDSIIAQQANAFKEKIDELNKALNQCKEKIATLTVSLSESEEKRKTLDEECVMTWQQCNALERDYAEALKRENELKRKLFETTAASESCLLSESEVVKLKEEKDALTHENLEFSRQIRSLKNEKRQMVSDFYKAKAKAKDAEAELAALKTRISELEKERIDLDLKNNSLTKKLIEVTDEKDNLSSSLNVLLVKYDALETSKNSATDDQLTCLRTQIQKLKTELVDKNAKITMLELQIQSENFPYRNKVLELENNISSYKKKCEDLRSQLRRHQASVQESTVQVHECPSCFARKTKSKSEVGVQTMAVLHLDGDRSSIVQANAEALVKDKVKKLEREHETLKRLCRLRASKISSLEQYIRQNNLPVPDAKENPELARPVAATNKSSEKEPASLTTRRVLTEANVQS